MTLALAALCAVLLVALLGDRVIFKGTRQARHARDSGSVGLAELFCERCEVVASQGITRQQLDRGATPTCAICDGPTTSLFYAITHE